MFVASNQNNLNETNVDNIISEEEISIDNIVSEDFQCRKSSVLQHRPEENENEKNVDNKNNEEKNSILLMKRTIEKMDNLQEELNNVRRDFFKLLSLNSLECNQNIGEKMDCDVEEG